jgi:phosphoribosylformylglycinamidine cyclo-ligase
VDAYRRAGVDVGAASEAVALIRELASAASRPEVVAGVGGFAGLFRLDEERLLAAAADGVGTKVEIARAVERFDTVGIDLVAMSANDVVCTGAEPLFFLDQIVVERLVPEKVAAVVAGVAEGCRRAGCALLGGETAEHPGHLEEGRFDLAGFCVGLVRRNDLLGPDRVNVGDALVGLPASGVHSNGFSLIRRAIADAGLDLRSTPSGLGRTLSEELLEPTLIYASALRAAAHVTGGGLPQNLPRALPDGLGATLDRGSWRRPDLFGFLQRLADISEGEMFGTFNMGLGMVLVVDRAGAGAVIDAVRAAGLAGSVIGEVTADPGVALR